MKDLSPLKCPYYNEFDFLSNVCLWTWLDFKYKKFKNTFDISKRSSDIQKQGQKSEAEAFFMLPVAIAWAIE